MQTTYAHNHQAMVACIGFGGLCVCFRAGDVGTWGDVQYRAGLRLRKEKRLR